MFNFGKKNPTSSTEKTISNSLTKDQQQHLWQKSKLVFNALQKSSWFTGISIKKHLKKHLFSLAHHSNSVDKNSNQNPSTDFQSTDFQNPAIDAGRWSAYCHQNQASSLQNLLTKQGIKEGSRLIFNPILPSLLVDELIKTQAETIPFDLDLSTLTFDPKKLVEYIQMQTMTKTMPIDVVVFYGVNGLYRPITESILELQKLGVASIIIIDNQNPNFELLDLFEILTLGGVVFNYGSSFYQSHLNQVLPQTLLADSQLEAKNLYVSWFIENRIRSVLEYNLSDAQTSYHQLLWAYLYLNLQAQKKDQSPLNLFATSLPIAVNEIYFDQKLKNPAMAVEKIMELYPSTLDLPLPDLIFDLQEELPVQKIDYSSPKKLIHLMSELHTSTKKVRNYLANYLDKSGQNSDMEIILPSLISGATYLAVFGYLVDENSGQSLLEDLQTAGFACQFGMNLHPFVNDFMAKNPENFPNLEQISTSIVIINLLETDQFGVAIDENL